MNHAGRGTGTAVRTYPASALSRPLGAPQPPRSRDNAMHYYPHYQRGASDDGHHGGAGAAPPPERQPHAASVIGAGASSATACGAIISGTNGVVESSPSHHVADSHAAMTAVATSTVAGFINATLQTSPNTHTTITRTLVTQVYNTTRRGQRKWRLERLLSFCSIFIFFGRVARGWDPWAATRRTCAGTSAPLGGG
jgi:hypothetical protein